MIFLLLVVFQIKHFVCDYLLQNKYMLGKFKDFPHYILPLICHVLVHGVFTYTILYMVNSNMAPKLALFDMVCHFIMDRIKASKVYLGKYNALSKNEMKNILSYKDTIGLDKFKNALNSNVYFWWSLGFDQMIHHLTHYIIIFLVV